MFEIKEMRFQRYYSFHLYKFYVKSLTLHFQFIANLLPCCFKFGPKNVRYCNRFLLSYVSIARHKPTLSFVNPVIKFIERKNMTKTWSIWKWKSKTFDQYFSTSLGCRMYWCIDEGCAVFQSERNECSLQLKVWGKGN